MKLMRNELEKFNDTVSILVKAYLNDELKHEDCSACVVGNLCDGNTLWKFLFMTCEGEQKPYLDTCINEMRFIVLTHHNMSEESLIQMAIKVCASTGYTVDELKRIEYTFETCNRGNSVEEYMFNGLMAVVDVLAEIHGIDLTAKEHAKTLFVK